MCREMKDSGVKWIGCIPKTWNITKIKMLSDIYTGTSISDDLKDKYTVKENATPYISTKDLDVSYKSIDYDNGLFIPNGEKGFRLAEKDSTLICIEGGSAGKKVAFTDREVNFVNKLCCIKSRNYNNKFIYYYINSSAFTEQFNLNLSGLIGGVSINLLKQIITVVPTVAEQQKISNYLDKKVSQIDDIISKQKSLIEKYKAYKQSLITETVTKGLNKNIPIKDSGVEWIGEIPSHWDVTITKNVSNKITDGAHVSPETENGVYDFISVVNLDNNFINFNECLKTSEVSYRQMVKNGCNPQRGDILISKDGTVGKSVVIDYDREFVIASSLVIVTPNKKMISYFLNYLIQSNCVQEQLNSFMKGSGLKRVSVKNNGKLYVTVPSISEQEDIVAFLDKKCNAIDSAISKKEQLIEKLESYKKSLIYECVTGKREMN
ncbi:restriction endonuclease subunit S [Clostridium tertium]|uniref:restriction endonuclease subunit S n=1 Tax=Clostridium tertium TaxID=1559 RepID=UPI00232F345F|nr:restriction endonuclease subunit S [Clostridium tertium]MDB1955459.1 restriction endonuclease subunit S [Clostridium tertium]MDB1957555.1 restriction endonuclease subunit S [Clostridium tertium]MDB1962701.1 restriction endonuclease subunit S [Clostridium tertium]MDB1966746.1 restriction endonuclease subunit S [Clostridium tertium]